LPLKALSTIIFVMMNTPIYVPYRGKRAKTIKVKGHRLLVLAREPEILEEGLELLGANWVRQFDAYDEQEFAVKIERLAIKHRAGVVFADGDYSLDVIIDRLRTELPWVQ
jgi:hypothetical protein